MKLPFDTHDIYVSLKRSEREGEWFVYYKINPDFSKTKVNKRPNFLNSKPFIVLDENEFLPAKPYLMDKQNPFKLDRERATLFYQIGFISAQELVEFLKKDEEDNFNEAFAGQGRGAIT